MSLLPIGLKARIHRRPFWAVKYRDGTVVDETQRDWTELSRKELVEVRLHTPDGQCAILGNTVDASDRAFQFKVAVRSIGPEQRQAVAMVVGLIHGTDGRCTCYAWEYPGRLVGPFEDNVHHMSYQNVGALGLANLSLKG